MTRQVGRVYEGPGGKPQASPKYETYTMLFRLLVFRLFGDLNRADVLLRLLHN